VSSALLSALLDYGKNNCASTISTGNQISDMTPTYAGHGIDLPADGRAEV
jgi:hypothetical protein